MQTVQRPECWGVILAFQSFSGIHSGIDNLNVLTGVTSLIDNTGVLLSLVKDGDPLLHLIRRLSIEVWALSKFLKSKAR